MKTTLKKIIAAAMFTAAFHSAHAQTEAIILQHFPCSAPFNLQSLASGTAVRLSASIDAVDNLIHTIQYFYIIGFHVVSFYR